jgi:hypothetical protein
LQQLKPAGQSVGQGFFHVSGAAPRDLEFQKQVQERKQRLQLFVGTPLETQARNLLDPEGFTSRIAE